MSLGVYPACKGMRRQAAVSLRIKASAAGEVL